MALLVFLALFGVFATVCVVIVNRRSSAGAYGDDATRRSVDQVHNSRRNVKTATQVLNQSDPGNPF